MRNDVPPRTENALRVWGQDVTARVATAPGRFGLTVQQSEGFSDRYVDYGQSLTLAGSSATRTPNVVATKNVRKREFLQYARWVLRMVSGNRDVTDDAKRELGLRVPSERQSFPVPADPPSLTLTGRGDTWVRARAHPASGSKSRGLPSGVVGVELYGYCGMTPPTSNAAFKSFGVSLKSVFMVDFGPLTPPGSGVWVVARWFNHQGVGPASLPLTVRVAGDLLSGGSVTSSPSPSLGRVESEGWSLRAREAA